MLRTAFVRALVNAVMNLRVQYEAEIFLNSRATISVSRTTLLHAVTTSSQRKLRPSIFSHRIHWRYMPNKILYFTQSPGSIIMVEVFCDNPQSPSQMPC